MVIAIDTRWIFKEFSGIGVYTLEIIKELINLDKENQYILFFSDKEVLDKTAEELKLDEASNFKTMFLDFGVFSIRNQLLLNRILIYNRVDVYHSPNYMIPILPRIGKASKIKYIVTIHDIIPLLFRDHAPKSKKSRLFPVFKFLMKSVVRQADTIITVSKASADDIVSFFSITNTSKVKAFYNACSEKFQPIAFEQKKNNQFLYVGRADPYKDITTLIRAMSIVLEDGYDASLIIAGSPDPRYPEAEELTRQLNLTDNITWTGYISEAELIRLYQESTALLHPSLYEGFGLQIIEAMQSGTPVISTNGGSLKEVCADAAIVIPTKSPDLFAENMKRILDNKHLRLELREKGLKHAQEFSWQQTARNLHELMTKKR